MQEYVPTITPIISANAKYFITSPPKKYSITTTISVVRDVTTVLDKVWFRDKLADSYIDSFKSFCEFSLNLSKITIVSFREYPTIVKNAATIDRSISKFNKEKIPKVINTSCTMATRLPNE